MHSQCCCSDSQMTVVSWLGSLHTATSGLELSSFEIIVLGSPLMAEAVASNDLADDLAVDLAGDLEGRKR